MASAALVLVLPVVAGAIIGGFAAGTASVLAGFVVYDFWFIPPYGHLSVASSQDWVVLAVYVAVMLAVARVVSNLESARAEALSRTAEPDRLFELPNFCRRAVGQGVVAGHRAHGQDPVRHTGRHAVAAGGRPLRSSLVRRGALGRRAGPARLQLRGAGQPGDVTSPDRRDENGGPVGLGATGGHSGWRDAGSEVDRALLRTFPSMPPWPWNGPSCGSRPSLEVLEEVDRLRDAVDGRGLPRPAHPAGRHQVASSTLLHPTPLSDADVDELPV